MHGLEGKKVLVTGASGGIGAAIVRDLVAAGADVVAHGRTAESLQALVDETGATPVHFDVSVEDEVKGALQGLDVWGVVNCAGFGGEIASPMDTDMAIFDQVMAVNARGTMLVTKYASQSMVRLGQGGSIVNVSSQASLVALPSHISYGASKRPSTPSLA
ncbi:SDR family NAD(P)-dependent oxidoreductase [Ornithinimicrobium sp. INDO-MA30-4]|nr:SDR family NAD(P)-dependent oxidoreductase [Ornithinimicrobium sp. INDO-MA30-4]UJH70004.1 SDR family NAD(P)-dependent oxidoreductase [Ornithinimicrobium sp. INDO-MA30-4]